MSALTTYSIRLKPGEDLKDSLIQLAKDKKLSAPFILTCCGSVSSATLRFAKPKPDLGKERVRFDLVYHFNFLHNEEVKSKYVTLFLLLLHTCVEKFDSNTEIVN